MNSLSKKIKRMIQVGYWPGFIVGMYPSQFSYKAIEIDINKIWKKTKELNIYYHIPFCKSKCPYCTFFSIVKNDNDYYRKYVNKLNQQFNLYNNCFEEKVNIKSICFGGGTPNILPISEYYKIFDNLARGNTTFDKDLEPSMEISPEIITNEYIKGLKEVGIKRLSLGVQSLKKDLRKSINRDKELNILNIIDDIRNNDMNMNIDLINGLQGQNPEIFMETLIEIVKFAPETISIYPLSGEQNSLFKKAENLMTTKDKYQLFDVFYDYLLSHGYRCESHVKFVKLNQDSTHQQKIYEYNGVETLGLGCGARSYNNYTHYALPYTTESCMARKSIDEYIEKDFNDYVWNGFKMNTEENKRRFIIYGFFLGELNLMAYKEKYKSSLLEEFKYELEALADNDLIIIENNKIYLTKKGRKYTDLVGTVFWSNDINKQFRECK